MLTDHRCTKYTDFPLVVSTRGTYSSIVFIRKGT